jgi:RnfABCDGE-type electron transport complex G subunit
MNERIKYPLVITVICLVAAGALALTYRVTKDRIRASERSELMDGLDAVLPEGEREVLDEATGVYVVRQGGEPVAYAATGEAQGYSSKIKVIVGLTAGKRRVTAMRILAQNETPGLGERSREVPPSESLWQAIGDLFGGADADEKEKDKPVPPFQAQFKDRPLDELRLDPDPKKGISKLSGATVTSKAVVRATRNAVATIESVVDRQRKEAEAK